jgi:hypothetical protein
MNTLGLPNQLQCISAIHLYAGAVLSGTGMGETDLCTHRFIMNLQWFSANEPIAGLLMYDKTEVSIRSAPIPPPRKHVWLFMGYRCEQCNQTFLLPSWIHSVDDVPRAVHHSCHGDGTPDYPQQLLKARVEQSAARIADRLILSDLIASKEGNRVAQLIAAVSRVDMEKMRQEMAVLEEDLRKGRY